MTPPSYGKRAYGKRAECARNATAKRLLALIDAKQTCLALSLDVTDSASLLQIADLVGPEICLLKVHVDILRDFTPDLPRRLQDLAAKHQFLLFEDRKFADIGHTVQMQYGGGLYRICDWADLITAHILPGPGIITALKEVGLPKQRGLLLLAQMSSQLSLTTNDYTQTAVQWARDQSDFVIGFIAMHKLVDDPQFLHLTPGIQLHGGKDRLGQQYQTPEEAIGGGSDVIIVGRGIYGEADPLKAARTYRERAWNALLQEKHVPS